MCVCEGVCRYGVMTAYISLRVAYNVVSEYNAVTGVTAASTERNSNSCETVKKTVP